MTFEEQARLILEKQPTDQVEAFLRAFSKSMRFLADYYANERVVVTVPPDGLVFLKPNAKRDNSRRAKQMDTDVSQVRHLLARLAAKPEFDEYAELFGDVDIALQAYELQREFTKKGHASQQVYELRALWMMDSCLSKTLPTLGRTFGPTTKRGQLAKALFGKRPSRDIRFHLDELTKSIPLSE